MEDSYKYNEATLSHLPALKLLVNMGWEYISKEEVLEQRDGDISAMLLQEKFTEQLKNINGSDIDEQEIKECIRLLKPSGDSLIKDNEKVYNLLKDGAYVYSSSKNKNIYIKYIDWDEHSNNKFYCTAEFGVSSVSGRGRFDIVLFINGIPLSIIECKAPFVDIQDAIYQIIRYQKEQRVFFAYMQILIATNQHSALYASVHADNKFWKPWREDEDYRFSKEKMQEILAAPIDEEQFKSICEDFPGSKACIRKEQNTGKEFNISEQSKLILSLCDHDRFLDIIKNFIIFEKHSKKLPRYHQYFLVKNALTRVSEIGENGRREGGIVWHVQGSGKTITMVMLTSNLKHNVNINNPRIILVTDRIELNKQLYNVFHNSGLKPEKADSGKKLIKLITSGNESVITTNIHKFDSSEQAATAKNESPNIFVLIDECHRTQYGNMALEMRRILPNAVYIGFTGTPIMKSDKDTFKTFGRFIEPTYPIRKALEDKVVVPLVYEGRDVNKYIDKERIDSRFDVISDGLDEENKNKLKKAWSRRERINQSQEVIHKRCIDIAEHFIKYSEAKHEAKVKAQIVTPNKISAIKYHRHLEEINKKYNKDIGKEVNLLSSKVVISAPGNMEGNENQTLDTNDEYQVKQFWQQYVIKKYGTENQYNDKVINGFIDGEDPKIIIVVDKLTTGFDAPNNTILYLCDKRTGHNLLQVIARVNRVAKHKDRGVIVDYEYTLEDLNQALNHYDALAKYSGKDIEDTLISIADIKDNFYVVCGELNNLLPVNRDYNSEQHWQRMIAKMHNIKNRVVFYGLFAKFRHYFAILRSSPEFVMSINDEEWGYLKEKRSFCEKIYKTINQIYRDAMDLSEYDSGMKALLNKEILAGGVKQVVKKINIFDYESKYKEKISIEVREEYEQELDINGYIENLMRMREECARIKAEDPLFYQTLSDMIRETLEKVEQLALEFADNEISAAQCDDRLKSIDIEEIKKMFSSKDMVGYKSVNAYYDVLNKYVHSEANCDAGINSEKEKLLYEIANKFKLMLEDNQGSDLWDYPASQKPIRKKLLYDIWKMEDDPEIKFSKGHAQKIVDDLMGIARARSRNKSEATSNTLSIN